MKTKIIISLMTLMLLAACGKNKQPAGKPASKPTMADVPTVLNQKKVKADDVLAITRKGEKVTIRWNTDFSVCQGIKISRNTTGKPTNRTLVASLPANSKEYVDKAPDAQPYWYWISIALPNNKAKNIGPMRAPEDADNSGNYAEAASDAQFTAQRTENAVVVAWDLPKADNYKSITIKRNSNAKFDKRKNPRTNIISTKEWRGDLVDQLPDSDADYWYWLDATKEDGSVVTKGPIRAEFAAVGAAGTAPIPLPNAPTVNASTNAKGKAKGKGKGGSK